MAASDEDLLIDLLTSNLDVSDYEELQTPNTSPIQGKHQLTPGSRDSVLPKHKRQATGI